MSTSALSRYLQVLTHVGIVEHEKNKKGYDIGHRALDYLIKWGLEGAQ
jgi:DNA-binding IclR family transcriptional regulator